jgi:hypothetical protein
MDLAQRFLRLLTALRPAAPQGRPLVLPVRRTQKRKPHVPPPPRSADRASNM